MLDRRYTQSRFYNGSQASASSQRGRDALVNRYLARARAENRWAQSYGGSTGGAASATGNPGVNVFRERSADIKDQRATFKEYGTGSLGARASIGEVRSFRDTGDGVGFSL